MRIQDVKITTDLVRLSGMGDSGDAIGLMERELVHDVIAVFHALRGEAYAGRIPPDPVLAERHLQRIETRIANLRALLTELYPAAERTI